MEGLLYYAPATFWAGVLYACTIVALVFSEWSRDKRVTEPRKIAELVIDEEELRRAA